MREQYADGLRSCEEALRREPGNLTVIHNLAVACEQTGHYEQGLAWARQGLFVDPDDLSLQRLQLRLKVLRLRQRVVQALGRWWG